MAFLRARDHERVRARVVEHRRDRRVGARLARGGCGDALAPVPIRIGERRPSSTPGAWRRAAAYPTSADPAAAGDCELHGAGILGHPNSMPSHPSSVRSKKKPRSGGVFDTSTSLDRHVERARRAPSARRSRPTTISPQSRIRSAPAASTTAFELVARVADAGRARRRRRAARPMRNPAWTDERRRPATTTSGDERARGPRAPAPRRRAAPGRQRPMPWPLRWPARGSAAGPRSRRPPSRRPGRSTRGSP